MSRAQKQTESFGNEVQSRLASLGNLKLGNITAGLSQGLGELIGMVPGLGMAGGAIAAVGGGLAKLAEEGMAAAKEQLGLTRRFDLSAEGAAAFQQAARLAGRSVDEATPGLVYMQRALAQAASGSSEAAHAFQRLGLNAGELSRLGVDEAMERVARGLAAVDGQARALSSRQIFGRNGQAAADLARRLAEGRDLAREFGLALSQADQDQLRSTQESIRRASATQAAARQSLAQEAALTFAPLTDAVSSMWTDVVTTVARGLREIRNLARPDTPPPGQEADTATGRMTREARRAEREFFALPVAEQQRALAAMRAQGAGLARLARYYEMGGEAGIRAAAERERREQQSTTAITAGQTALEDQTRTLRDQAATLGMTTEAAARYTAIQTLMRNGAMSEADAQRALAVQLRANAQVRRDLAVRQQFVADRDANLASGESTRNELDLIRRRNEALQNQGPGVHVDMSREEQALAQLRERAGLGTETGEIDPAQHQAEVERRQAALRQVQAEAAAANDRLARAGGAGGFGNDRRTLEMRAEAERLNQLAQQRQREVEAAQAAPGVNAADRGRAQEVAERQAEVDRRTEEIDRLKAERDAMARRAVDPSLSPELQAAAAAAQVRLNQLIEQRGRALEGVRQQAEAGNRAEAEAARLEALRFAREQAQIMQRGRELTQQQRTPAEVFADRAAELNQLLDRGGIDFATHAQALAAAAEQAAGPQQEAQGPASLSEGSVAAVQAINRFNRPQENIQDRILRLAEEANEQRRMQIRGGQDIARELREGGTLARLRLGR